MDTRQKLDPSSSIVQRVLRLRECMARYEVVVPLAPSEEPGSSTNVSQARRSYRWQMWQKSDSFAYAEDEPGHQCKW